VPGRDEPARRAASPRPGSKADPATPRPIPLPTEQDNRDPNRSARLANGSVRRRLASPCSRSPPGAPDRHSVSPSRRSPPARAGRSVLACVHAFLLLRPPNPFYFHIASILQFVPGLQFLKCTYPGLVPISRCKPSPIFQLKFSGFFRNNARLSDSELLSGWTERSRTTSKEGPNRLKMGRNRVELGVLLECQASDGLDNPALGPSHDCACASPRQAGRGLGAPGYARPRLRGFRDRHGRQ
jgi:hypothetical protein